MFNQDRTNVVKLPTLYHRRKTQVEVCHYSTANTNRLNKNVNKKVIPLRAVPLVVVIMIMIIMTIKTRVCIYPEVIFDVSDDVDVSASIK